MFAILQLDKKEITETDKKQIGERIRLIKEEKGYTLKGLGELLIRKGKTISKYTINSWIRGLSIPPADVITQLAIISGRSEQWILTGEELLSESPSLQVEKKEKSLEQHKINYTLHLQLDTFFGGGNILGKILVDNKNYFERLNPIEQINFLLAHLQQIEPEAKISFESYYAIHEKVVQHLKIL